MRVRGFGKQVSGQITDQQWETLRQLGCKVPPRSLSRVSAGRLITYIRFGNGTIGGSSPERARIALSYREKWIGKKVRCVGSYIDRGRTGTVTDLRARLIDEVVATRKAREEHGGSGKDISPFEASIIWDATETLPVKNRPAITVSLFYLELINETADQQGPG